MTEFENDFNILDNHTIAYMGQKGSGKTFLMMATLEAIKDKNVIFLDTLGVVDKTKHKNVIFIDNITPNTQNYKEIIKVFDKLNWNTNKVKVVLDLKAFDIPELVIMIDMISLYLLDRKIATAFMVDEISDYARQGKRKPYCKAFERLVRVGRNYGVTPVIMATQRPQLTEKDILALSDCFVIFRLMYSLDREVVRDLIGQSKNEFTPTDKYLKSAKERSVIIITQDNPEGLMTKVCKI